ncbi:MAG TPA: hypothetical protein VFN74_00535 [Chloroflexota bacterium]|nr:hypothetical protein [Chloroflexota bacterium]
MQGPAHGGWALTRRGYLAAALYAAGAAGCAAPTGPSKGAGGDVYVALARARAIAVLDPASDRETERISLAPLGDGAHPWLLGVSPSGGAAVVPLRTSASIGLVSADVAGGVAGGTGRARGLAGKGAPRRCARVGVESGRRPSHPGWTREAAQALTADTAGRAYVLVGDGGSTGPSYAAVVNLDTGAVQRHLPLAAAGEAVLALQASRDGAQLYVSVWGWGDGPDETGGAGRLVAVNTSDGHPTAQASAADDGWRPAD